MDVPYILSREHRQEFRRFALQELRESMQIQGMDSKVHLSDFSVEFVRLQFGTEIVFSEDHLLQTLLKRGHHYGIYRMQATLRHPKYLFAGGATFSWNAGDYFYFWGDQFGRVTQIASMSGTIFQPFLRGLDLRLWMPECNFHKSFYWNPRKDENPKDGTALRSISKTVVFRKLRERDPTNLWGWNR